MRVPFLGVIVLCAAPFLNLATALQADTFPVRWESDQPLVLRAPNADSPPAVGSLPGPPYTENPGPWLSGAPGIAACSNQDCLSCLLCPCGYAYAEGLFLTRTNGSADQPIMVDAQTGQTLLATNDLSFNWAPGLRAGAGFRVCDGWYVDLGYLGLFDSNASATMLRPDPAVFPSFPGPLGPRSNVFFGTDEVRADYNTQLNSCEINLLCCNCCSTEPCAGDTWGRSFEWFGGFRYISLNETLLISGKRRQPPITGAFETGEYDLYTNNNLYGAQLGARTRFSRGRLGCEATAKAGIFGNDAYEQQTLVDFPNYALRPTTTGAATQVAFAGEINLAAIYQLTKTWNVRAGYNLLWIDGVALAPNQMDFTVTPTSGSQLNNGGSVFYHGASIGLEARW